MAFFRVFFLQASIVFAQQLFCANSPAGQVVWWGDNIFEDTFPSGPSGGAIESDDGIITNFVAVAAHQSQGLALKSDGTVLAFGLKLQGGSQPPAGLSNVMSVMVAGNSCWAIKSDGHVVRWGNFDHDLADAVAGLSDVTAITWGGDQTYLALKNDSTVVAWSFDMQFLMNHRPGKAQIIPITDHGQVLSNVVAIASMDHSPLLLKRDGTILSFLGQPGSLDFVSVGGTILSNVVAISGSDHHALALRHDGTVVAWGQNLSGETNLPKGLSNVVAIATDDYQSMALKRDGTVVAWGDNFYGQAYVPAHLSNVVAIAAGGCFSLALTTGKLPATVFFPSHGRLDKMAADADLVFKGRVISTLAETNAAFPDWGKPHATEFEVISILKGNPSSKIVTFWHTTHGPMAWSGGGPPPNYKFEVGRSYLVFAVKADKPDWLYTPATNHVFNADEFRQLIHGEIAIHTLDARPLDDLSVKEAHWFELNQLLNDSNPSNQLYAIDNLDRLSLAGRSDDRWARSDDFKRKAVLNALLPLITVNNEIVARRAISCFTTESNAAVALRPFAEALIKVAADGASFKNHLAAIGSLSGTHFEAVSNSLAQLLTNSDEDVRMSAVGLLTPFPGEFTENALRASAADNSPKVRAAVADVIGNGKFAGLLPILVELFADPVGLKQVVSPFTIDDLQGGGGRSSVAGDVHEAAGCALLKFESDTVSDILKTNLNDPRFRLQFLCKLAATDPQPWIADMVQIMEERRSRILKKALANHFPPGPYMVLSGTYFECWKTICNYLRTLPIDEFANGKMDRYLSIIENSGTTYFQEPETVYEIYRMKGMTERAMQYRSHCEKTAGYDISFVFKRVDAQYPLNPATGVH